MTGRIAAACSTHDARESAVDNGGSGEGRCWSDTGKEEVGSAAAAAGSSNP